MFHAFLINFVLDQKYCYYLMINFAISFCVMKQIIKIVLNFLINYLKINFKLFLFSY